MEERRKLNPRKNWRCYVGINIRSGEEKERGLRSKLKGGRNEETEGIQGDLDIDNKKERSANEREIERAQVNQRLKTEERYRIREEGSIWESETDDRDNLFRERRNYHWRSLKEDTWRRIEERSKQRERVK